MTDYVVRKDREGTVRIYHRKAGVAVAEFYHHAAGDALAIKDILDGKDGLLPVEVKKKARGTLEELTAFAIELGLPASDGDYVYHKWEGSGWRNGSQPIKDWRATMRAWKAAGYFPSQKISFNSRHGIQNNTRPSGSLNTPGRYSSGAK